MTDQGARLDHVGLAVADLDGAASWFCEVFGLVRDLALRVEPLDLSIEMLIHPGYGYRVELLHRPGSAADGKPGTPARPRCTTDTDTWRSTSPTSTPPTNGPSPAGHGRSCRRARRRNPGCGWRSSPTRRATSSSCCTGRRRAG